MWFHIILFSICHYCLVRYECTWRERFYLPITSFKFWFKFVSLATFPTRTRASDGLCMCNVELCTDDGLLVVFLVNSLFLNKFGLLVEERHESGTVSILSID